MQSLIDVLNALPLAGLMLVIAVGYALGEVSARDISLGPASLRSRNGWRFVVVAATANVVAMAVAALCDSLLGLGGAPWPSPRPWRTESGACWRPWRDRWCSG